MTIREAEEPLIPDARVADGLPSKETQWGKGRRCMVLLSAIVTCFLTSGLAFGFSALLPELLEHGAFRDECGPVRTPGPCSKQREALRDMFTLGTSALNMMALVTGVVLDRLGPRATATCYSIAVAIGCLLFGHGSDGPAGHVAYNAGFLLLSIGGPGIYNCTLSFPNLFPSRSGILTAAIVGFFGASSAVFLGLASVIKSGVSIKATFTIYSFVPLAAAVVSWTQWPARPVRAGVPSIAEEEEKSAEVAQEVVRAPLEDVGLRRQILSVDFGLVACTTAVNMCALNFFIATCFEQMSEFTSDAAAELTEAFSLLLPLGGFVFVPFVGKVLDRFGPARGFGVLWCFTSLFQVLLYAYSVTENRVLAYSAFAVFAFCRPLFYTLGAAFCGRTFGWATFGKTFGLMMTISGCMNSLVAPLGSLASTRGFHLANLVLAVAQLATLALPVRALFSGKRQQRAHTLASRLSVASAKNLRRSSTPDLEFKEVWF